jgi:hypothetical protein
MKTTGWQVFVLALLIALAACSKKSEETGSKGTDNGQTPGELAASGAEVSGNHVDPKEVGALVDLIVAEAAYLPRAEFDPAARAAKLGKDPQAHFEWVRDHTWWAPYRGLLRGSKGVMLDRVGSSLDRAVLLGDLLRRAGYTVRLAHADLPENVAREAFSKVRPMPDQRGQAAGTTGATGALPANRARLVDRAIPGFQQKAQTSAAAAKQRVADGVALIRAQTDAILAEVHDGATPSQATEEQAAIRALRDHWWIEIKADGAWTAMDVLLPDAQVGKAVVAAATTVEWPQGAEFPSIADADWHVVDVRVVMERYDAGKTSEIKLIEASLRPAEVLEAPIILGHAPQPVPDTMPDPVKDPQATRAAALNVREWWPLLRIGNKIVSGSGFNNEGEVVPLPDSLGDIAKIGVAGPASTMDFTLGFSGGQELPAATAEWIDYEIRVPGEPSQKLRRPVFDLLGPARRASHAADFDGSADLRKLERAEVLLGRTDILLQPASFSGGFVSHLLADAVLANQALLKQLAAERDPKRAKELLDSLADSFPTWGPLLRVARARSILSETADSFIDRPNILNYRAMLHLAGADAIEFREYTDIAANGTGTRNSNAFAARVHQGVTDTVAEMLALNHKLGDVENTAAVFAKLAEGGSRGMLIRASDAAAVRELPWPEDEAARVGADIDAGYMAVVPRQAVLINNEQHVGWWRIDPLSGETIGVMDSGYNSTSESGATYRAVLRYYWTLSALFVSNYHRFQALMWEAEMFLSQEEVQFIRWYRGVEAELAVLSQQLQNMPKNQ